MSLMGQYEYMIDKNHPRANEEGQVYVHVLEAEKKLGRFLLQEEVVHHIDENKLNNHPDNLMVFATKSDHTSFHQYGQDKSIIRQSENGSYVCVLRSNICPVCGNEKDSHAKVCRNCYKPQRKVRNRPSRDELKQMIRSSPFVKIGKKYNVSDNTIKKWCDSYNLPKKKNDIVMYSEDEWNSL